MNYNKNKVKTFIISGIVALLFVFLIYPFFEIIYYKHKIVFGDSTRYSWLLNDSIKLDTTWSKDPKLSIAGRVRESDIYYNYNLANGIDLHVLEFPGLDKIKLKDIIFDYTGDFSRFKKRKIVIYNKDIKGWPEISIKFKLPFDNTLKVNLDVNSDWKNIKDTVNCKAFFGSLNKMSLANENGEQLVLFDFQPVPKAIITFYKTNFSFYVIIITSDRDLDENGIKVLKLK
ncbi:MAG TPA: hypothetical protein PKI01_02985 [Bacteroidales bacterium]|nr:hypothetical protein [Bacteroidales bacterium]